MRATRCLPVQYDILACRLPKSRPTDTPSRSVSLARCLVDPVAARPHLTSLPLPCPCPCLYYPDICATLPVLSHRPRGAAMSTSEAANGQWPTQLASTLGPRMPQTQSSRFGRAGFNKVRRSQQAWAHPLGILITRGLLPRRLVPPTPSRQSLTGKLWNHPSDLQGTRKRGPWLDLSRLIPS